MCNTEVGDSKEAFEEGKASGDAIEDQSHAVAILHAGGVGLEAQHLAEGLGD